MARPHVLQVGMDPDVIDLSPWPGQTADQLRTRITTAADSLRDAGYDVTVCLLPDNADNAETTVSEFFAATRFDIVEIGSGLRTSHQYTTIFERVVNTITASQPGVRFCFNDSPETTLEAVRRCSRG